jgi:uncharacterized coiled-coil DUF342 family protein
MGNNYSIEVPNVSADQLPKVIGEKYSEISAIDEKIKSATSKANKAKELADEASQKNADRSLFHDNKREAIEALQKSNQSLADALSENVVANEQLFQNQQKMAKGLSYLFGLGVMSIAANRTVVRELEMKLRDASEEELSDLARQEIYNVVLQLRAQEDMQYKIDKVEANIREINGQIGALISEVNSFKSSCNSALDEVKSLDSEVRSQTARQDEEFSNLKSGLKDSISQNLAFLQAQLNESVREKEQNLNQKLSHYIKSQDVKIAELEKFKEEELAKRSFLTSKAYNIIITLIGLAALLLSILR